MKAIIIEDEVAAANALQALISEVEPEIEISAILQSIDESVEWFQTSPRPDLVFMDIHLADGSAFSIFEQVTISCPIIFTTAYDEFALKAFEVNSIDYILKPIDKRELSRAIQKFKNLAARNLFDNNLLTKLLYEIKQNSNVYKASFLIPVKDKFIPLSACDIACIYIDGKTLKALTFSGVSFNLDGTLDDWILQLDPKKFYRANRQYIIAKQAIKDASIWFGGKLSANLSVQTPERIIVSKARVGDFKKWFTAN